jgi:TonB family protein
MRNFIRGAQGRSPARILRVTFWRSRPFRRGPAAIVLACLVPALAASGVPDAETDAAADTITSPGFAVEHRHCDGSESTPVVLPLPRPLGRRHAGASLEIEARLDPDGRVAGFRRLSGSRQLEDELEFSLQRSRFAPGSDCVQMRFRVTDTVLKAADVARFRLWADVTVDADGAVRDVRLVDHLPAQVAGSIRRRIAEWTLRPSHPVPAGETWSTSVWVETELVPAGPERMSVSVRRLRAGPRPVRELRPALPGRLKGQRVDGRVEVAFMVDEHGRPRDPVVLAADRPGEFDRYAVMTVKRWRYKPVTVAGKPVPAGPVSVVLDFAEARFRETNRTLLMSRRDLGRMAGRGRYEPPWPEPPEEREF